MYWQGKNLSFYILLDGVPDQLQTKLLKFSYARIQTEPEHQMIGNREKVMIRQERGLWLSATWIEIWPTFVTVN